MAESERLVRHFPVFHPFPHSTIHVVHGCFGTIPFLGIAPRDATLAVQVTDFRGNTLLVDPNHHPVDSQPCYPIYLISGDDKCKPEDMPKHSVGVRHHRRRPIYNQFAQLLLSDESFKYDSVPIKLITTATLDNGTMASFTSYFFLAFRTRESPPRGQHGPALFSHLPEMSRGEYGPFTIAIAYPVSPVGQTFTCYGNYDGQELTPVTSGAGLVGNTNYVGTPTTPPSGYEWAFNFTNVARGTYTLTVAGLDSDSPANAASKSTGVMIQG